MVRNGKSLLTYKFQLNSDYMFDKHGYYIKNVWECKNEVNQFDQNNGNRYNMRQKWAAPKNFGSNGKIIKKCINPDNEWKLIKSELNWKNNYDEKSQYKENFTNQILEYDQELANCNNEITIKNHKDLEGRLIKKEIVIGERSITKRDEYLEKYGSSCKLCGKSYLKTDGINFIIDVHHLNPIANGERNTNIDKDLVGLCPNCHRFVHSIKDFEKKSWDEIEQLFNKIYKNHN